MDDRILSWAGIGAALGLLVGLMLGQLVLGVVVGLLIGSAGAVLRFRLTLR